MGKLAEGTKFLAVRSGPRCGAAGMRILGQHFKPDKATVVAIADLKPGRARKLLVNPDLIVEQHAQAPAEKSAPAPKPKAEAKPAPAAKPEEKPKPKVRKKEKAGD